MEAELPQSRIELGPRLRFHAQAGERPRPSPLDQRLQGLCLDGDRPTRHVAEARPTTAHLYARASPARQLDALDLPAGTSLDLPPTPGLE